MKLARVAGTVISTIQNRALDGHALLLCDLLNADGSPQGGYLIALDTVGAGAGETVLILDEGNSARAVLHDDKAPVRSVIVAIVDAINLT